MKQFTASRLASRARYLMFGSEDNYYPPFYDYPFMLPQFTKSDEGMWYAYSFDYYRLKDGRYIGSYYYDDPSDECPCEYTVLAGPSPR